MVTNVSQAGMTTSRFRAVAASDEVEGLRGGTSSGSYQGLGICKSFYLRDQGWIQKVKRSAACTGVCPSKALKIEVTF